MQRKKRNAGGRKRTRCGGGGAAGRTTSLVVLRWRPVAVSWLADGGSKRRCGSNGGEREISSSSPILCFFVFNGSLLFGCFSLFRFTPFFLFSVCSFSSLSLDPSLSSLRVFSSFPFLFVPPPACWPSVSIYRGQRERGLIMAAWGAGQRRSVGRWVRLARRDSPDFSS